MFIRTIGGGLIEKSQVAISCVNLVAPNKRDMVSNKIISYMSSSFNPISVCNFSTLAQRIRAHIILDREQQLQTIANTYLGAMKPVSKEKFLSEHGPFNHTESYTLNAFNSLVERNAKSSSVNRWENYPISDINCLPGCGIRYSSQAAALLGELLPQILKHKGNNIKPSLIEVGGFTFNDLFLFHTRLAESGMDVAEHIGIDVNHKGKLAADAFNNEIARIEKFRIITGDALSILSRLNSQVDNKLLIALRFLAVLSADEIHSFFREVTSFLKPSEIFIFNYTKFTSTIENMKNVRGWTLSSTGGIHV